MDITLQSWSWRLLSIALLFSLCVVVTSVHAQSRNDRPLLRLEPFPAPDFTLPTLSGETIRLTDLKGKVVLLNFWATWCVPCRAEMSTIEALYQQYKDRGLEVVAVSIDKLSTAPIAEFIQDVKGTFTVALDPEWTTARTYKLRGLPTTFLINRTGNVIVRELGERDWMDEASWMIVEELLQEPGAAK